MLMINFFFTFIIMAKTTITYINKSDWLIHSLNGQKSVFLGHPTADEQTDIRAEKQADGQVSCTLIDDPGECFD